jgi:hypothetical protein
MASCEPESDSKKRKSTQVSKVPDLLVINYDDDSDDVQSLRETKARRVSTDGATLRTLAASNQNQNANANQEQKSSLPVTAHADTLVTIEGSQRREASAQTSPAFESTAQEWEALEHVGKLIHHLFRPDLFTMNASLDALFMYLSTQDEDESSSSSSKKCETIIAVGGVHALVLLLDKFLALAVAPKFKASKCTTSTTGSNIQIPPDQITLVDGVIELETLDRTLDVIINLTFQNETSRSSISAIGGVEVIVKVMKTLPKCRQLQWSACHALRNLTTTAYSSSSCNMNIGKKRLLQEDGIKLLLATVNKHLDSSSVCETALGALENIIVTGSYQESIRCFIREGGGATLAIIREEWPYNDDVQTLVRTLAKFVVDEMRTWAEEEE